MNNKCVAIVSKHTELIHFFELEALYYGIETHTYDRIKNEVFQCDMCIIDADTVKILPDLMPCKVLFVSSAADESAENGYIRYPASVEKLDKIYIDLLSGCETKNADENDSEKIYFFNSAKNMVRYNGTDIRLSDYEWKLLRKLCENAGDPVSRECLNSLFGASGGNIADVYVCRLRKKLEMINGKRVIFTVRSKGYKITVGMERK